MYGHNHTEETKQKMSEKAFIYPLDIREKAIEYRKIGLSYGDIAKKLNIQYKQTIWLWCKCLR